MQPRQMPLDIQDFTVADRTDLIHPIGELRGAVVDRDRGLAIRQITAIYIGNP